MPSHRSNVTIIIAVAALLVPAACTRPEDAPQPPAISGLYDSWTPGTDMALTRPGRQGGGG